MLLEPYHNSLLKRIIKAPKIIMMDTGLCCYLTRWNSPESLEVGAMAGSILETWVVSEIAKSFINAGRKPPLYYYRDTDKREIDLLILDEDRVHPIEIKKGANPNRSDISSFAVLKRSGLKIGAGGVICLRDEALPLDDDNWIIPVSII
jgi:predicted AAA+ superfamily ATPase